MATRPSLPSAMAPGTWQNSSQMDGSRPSSSAAPSIWKAEVAAPHWNDSGNLTPLIP